MPRTTINPTSCPGPYPIAAVDLPFVAADIVNKNQVKWTGKELVIAWNTDGVNSYTATVSSANDSHNRSGNIGPKTIAAGAVAIMAGPLPNDGWRQSDGYIYCEASNVAVKFAVITLP